MAKQHFGKTYYGNAPEFYERFFVPAIGAPLATDLIGAAALRPGERALDVACGTGVVTRLALQQVGATGTVAGLDVNPGMLAVARSITSPGTSVAQFPIDHFDGLERFEDLPRDKRCVADYRL